MNATQQKAYDIASGCIQACLSWIAIIVVLTGLATWAQNKWFPNKTDATDKDQWTRSQMELCVDYGTGCHYLYKHGSLIPRLDTDGKQVTEP